MRGRLLKLKGKQTERRAGGGEPVRLRERGKKERDILKQLEKK